MSEGAAEAPSGGADALSGDQFGEVTGSTDLPPYDSAQNPGSGLAMYGFYPYDIARKPKHRARRRKHKRD
jgi:hypothetical protein